MYNLSEKISLTQSQSYQNSTKLMGQYLLPKKFIKKNNSFYQIKTLYLFIWIKNSIDIDDQQDWDIAEKLYYN